MTLFHPPSGFRIPEHSGWEITEALCSKKPVLFWRGEGRYSYPVKGPNAWVKEEVPDSPEEPRGDRRDGAYPSWLKAWRAYALQWGIPCASKGTRCCDAYAQCYTFERITDVSLDPPAALRDEFQRLFGVGMMAFTASTLFFGYGWSFDMFKFLECVMRKNHDSLREFEAREESAADWICKHYGDRASELVREVMAWSPTEQQRMDYLKPQNEYCVQRDKAMATTRKLK